MDLYDEKLRLYEELIKTHPNIERKGKTMPYTAVNGHMFSQLSKEGHLGVRLPENERMQFLERYHTTLFESYGAVMKEYVKVPEKLLRETETLKKYLEISYEYVKSLKPKSTKKK